MVDEQILRKINDYYSFCKAKHYAHLKAAENYKYLYNYTTSPIIVLSSLTTILASYSVNSEYIWLPMITAVLSGIVTIAHSLTSFLEFNIKHENHLKTSYSYINLAWLIENEFLIKYYNNPGEITELYTVSLFEKIHKELVNIQNNELCLPSTIANGKFLHDYYNINDIGEALIEVPPINAPTTMQQASSSRSEQPIQIIHPIHNIV